MAAGFKLFGLFRREDGELRNALSVKLELQNQKKSGVLTLALNLSGDTGRYINYIAWTIVLVTWGVITPLPRVSKPLLLVSLQSLV